VTGMPAQPGGAWPGLLEKLLAAVRPEFRGEVLVPDPDDPVLGRRTCPVPGCDRAQAENGLCSAHGNRWRERGRPDLAEFLADPGPVLNGRRQLTGCTVTGCRYGSSGAGMCMRHRSAWERAGRPDPAAWAERAPAPGPGAADCLLPFCDLWTENDKHSFCKAHDTRWRQLGRPDAGEFLAHCLVRGKAHIDFRGLAPQLKLELQYGVQCRRDQQTITLPPPVAAWAIRQARNAGVGSLLHRSAAQWRELAADKHGNYPAFLLFARDAVEALAEGTGWESEYPRDVWRADRLPGLVINPGKAPSPRIRLRFDRIAQPWLRELAKRWTRLRLSSGLTVATIQSDAAALTRFSAFLAEAVPGCSSLQVADRPLLERYLAWLAGQPIGHGVREDAITAIGMFFQAIRQHGWDDTLPATAAFFPGDIPRRPPRLTRHLAEHIMAQVEAPASLDRWPSPEGRLVTVILIRCGLRATDACTLAFDCLLHDGQGAPYLRYFNHKMRREAAVPIDEELQAEIRAQQQRVAARWPGDHPHLFPAAERNAAGRHPLTYYSYRGMLNRWLRACDIRDEHGDPVRLTPHQWRHTFACRLINQDVPQEVIRVLLDHESMQMTSHYARLSDQTVRRRREQATKVNIKGERVALDPGGPLSQAQWAKTRYGLATQTLPHGYCGLPVQKSCPHANACLTCPVFLSGPEFLPELREQHHRTLTLIEASTRKGQTRVAEMNQQVLTNLDKMIGEIEKDNGSEAADAG
jgi:integrase